MKEAPSSYYDNAFMNSPWFTGGMAEIIYAEIYRKAMEDIFDGKRKDIKILDLGCGMGLFPDFLKKNNPGGYTYSGVDFSKVAIKICSGKGYDVRLHDLRDGIPEMDYNIIVSFETLEHIIDDLKVLSGIRKSTLICLSVPEFDEPSHMRFFTNIGEVIGRFSGNIKIDRCEKINRWWYLSGRIR